MTFNDYNCSDEEFDIVPQAVKSLNNAKKLVFDYPEELRCTSKAPTVKRFWPI
jgi:hypothetical protein